jgi:hypothetical protein
MKRSRAALYLSVGVLAALGCGVPLASQPVPLPAAAVVQPLPAALHGHPLAATYSPRTLVSAPWADPANHPGNCPTVNSHAVVNAAGYAQISTSGVRNDCRSIQSPRPLPTRPGYVYEALINFSSFHDWPAFWMYGPNWPQQGEIDAVEGGPGASFVTWHQGGGNPDFTVGPDPWDDRTVPYAGFAHDIKPGVWTTVDISFTTSGVDVYYNGSLYVHIPERVTTSGGDPMYVTISEGSCDSAGVNVCNGGSSPHGTVQVRYLRVFS